MSAFVLLLAGTISRTKTSGLPNLALGPCAMIHRDTYDVFLDEQVARQQRVARERAERERERERL